MGDDLDHPRYFGLDVTSNSAGGAGAGVVALSGGLVLCKGRSDGDRPHGRLCALAADMDDDVVISAAQDVQQSAFVGSVSGSLVAGRRVGSVIDGGRLPCWPNLASRRMCARCRM